MKNIIVLFVLFVSFVALIVSCDKMNDIHQKYLDAGERVYLGKTDSVKAYPGIGRVKLEWYANADPKLETTVIFWNMRQDSVEIPFTRIQDGVQKESFIVEGLPEGEYFFEFVNKNRRGERSMTAVVQGRSYGETYESSLTNRFIVSSLFDDVENSITIVWDVAGPTAVGIKLDYTDIHGDSRTMLVDNSETTTTIPDFKAGEPLFYATLYKPVPEALDEFQAPTVTVPYYANVTNLLKNTQIPFTTAGSAVYGDYYPIADWTANTEAAKGGNVGTGYDNALCLYAWDGYPSTSVTNGKLYQTVDELEAGTYRMIVTSGIFWGTPNRLYITAALGSDLPDVEDLAGQALAFTTTPNGDDTYTIEFEISENSIVSLGFVAHLGPNEWAFFNKIELWRKY